MDKVTAAQEEYDRLKDEQLTNDSRRAELHAQKIEAMNKANKAHADIETLKDDRKANSERMAELRKFLDFAETIG